MAPLPKVHNQDVGAPVEVSVSVTANGAIPEMAEAVKLAVGAGAGAVTVMVLDTGALAPLALEAVKVTVYVPAVAYVATGFCTVEVVPLPRVHAQDVGVPVEVSVMVTDNGAIPEMAEAVKLAVGAGTADVTA